MSRPQKDNRESIPLRQAGKVGEVTSPDGTKSPDRIDDTCPRTIQNSKEDSPEKDQNSKEDSPEKARNSKEDSSEKARNSKEDSSEKAQNSKEDSPEKARIGKEDSKKKARIDKEDSKKKARIGKEDSKKKAQSDKEDSKKMAQSDKEDSHDKPRSGENISHTKMRNNKNARRKTMRKNIIKDAGGRRRKDSSLPAALLVCAFLFVWQAAAMKMSAAYILPSPVRVIVRLWELRGPLFGAHLPATMQVVAIGLVISIFLGLGLAILMDFSPVAHQALYPLIIASQTIPTTALAPLFVLWFGYSIWSRVLVTVLFTFFPVVVTVYDGFRSIPTEMKELMDTYGATPAQVFLKLKLPAVLPYFFSALKMAVPLSVIGAAIGEWLGAQSGLGYFSRRMMTQLDGAGVFAPILLLSIAAELLVVIVGLLEKHFLYWRSAE